MAGLWLWFGKLALRALGIDYIGILKKYWREILIIALVLGVWWYHHSRTIQIEHLQAQVVQLQQDNAACKAEVDKQNQKILEESQKSKQAVEDSQKKAEKEIQKAKKDYATALDKIKHQPVAKTCTGAIDQLRKAPRGDLAWPK